MSSSEQFIAAIIARPQADDTRLVYADWLEERGQIERAELIRIQIEALALPESDLRRQLLQWRATWLIEREGERFRSELPVLEGVTWLDFERGFVTTVRVDSIEALFTHDKAIAAASPVYRVEILGTRQLDALVPEGSVPWLRALRLLPAQSWTRRREQIPLVPHEQSLVGAVERLEFVRLGQHTDLRWLIEGGPKPKLKSLHVDGNHVSGHAIAEWAAEASMASLVELDIGTRFVDYNSGYFEDPTLGSRGAELIASAPHLSGLERLRLDRQRIGVDGLSAIVAAGAPSLRALQARYIEVNRASSLQKLTGSLYRLDLSGNPIGDEGAVDIASAPSLARLERLDLDTCEIGAAGIAALCRAPFWPSLRKLDLSRNPLGLEGLRALANAERPANLHTLSLADCDLDASSAAVLDEIPWLRDLFALDLSNNALGSAWATGLAAGSLRSLSAAETGIGLTQVLPLLSRLVHLDMSGGTITDEEAELLCDTEISAPQLQMLRLSKMTMSARALQGLGDQRWPRLQGLTLSRTPLALDALSALLRSPMASNLVELELSSCGLDLPAAQALASAENMSQLRRLGLLDNELTDDGLLAIARSPALAAVSAFRVEGDAWSMSEENQQILSERFGVGWNYRYQEDEDDNEELWYESIPFKDADEDEDEDENADENADEDDLPF